MKLSSAYIREQLQKETGAAGQDGLPEESRSDVYEEKVLDSVQEIYDECDEWESHLREEVMRGRSLQQILKFSMDFIGNPLLVMSLDFTLLGEAGTESMPEKFCLFQNGGINMEHMNALMHWK